jgi:polygalacturonase
MENNNIDSKEAKVQGEFMRDRRKLLKTVGLAGVAAVAGNLLNVENTVSASIASYYIDVKDQGAIGDGVTDDYSAFQSALDIAKNPSDIQNSNKSVIVFVPEGTYVVKQELRLYRNTTLQMSPKARIIRQHNGYILKNGYKRLNETQGSPETYGGYNGHGNIKIINGIFDANADNYPSQASGFHFGHGDGIFIDGVTILDVANSHAIEFNACQNVYVTS